VWRRAAESLSTTAVPDEWFIVLALHCIHIVAICLHALQALTALPVCTSGRLVMTLMPGALETCARALGICVPNYTDSPASFFFMLEARDSHGATGYVASLELGHVIASEPTSAGRRDPES
jgi:hypothetical protein